MRALHRKLFRDLIKLRSQTAAIALVMACGVATFVMSLSMLDSLQGTMDRYYEEHRFANVFASMKRAPLSLAERVREIPGVGEVESRVVEAVTLDMPLMEEPASGSVVSLPSDSREGINRLYVRSGRFPEGRGSLEVLVSQRFAEAHGLAPGDGVNAVLNGRLETLRVVGVALSPEYVWLIPPGGILPENKRYGVFWMGREEMDAAFDMKGAFNDLAIRVMPGADEAEIIERVDELTAQYGGLGAYEREDQISHKFVANELEELRAMTLIVPAIFLGVAAFLLNIVLSRMISAQREQIAALKALGYSSGEIGRHYLSFVLLIACVSGVVGAAGGAWMGRGLTRIYVDFMDFPSFEYDLHPRVLLLGFVVSAVAAMIGVASALRAAMRLPPAEAMKQQAPQNYRPTVLERAGLQRFVPLSARMIIRHIERRPLKTALSVLGIALACAILVVGGYSEDSVDYLLDFQFQRVQRYDVEVVFGATTDDRALSSIRALPGVLDAEPYRALPVRLRSDHWQRRTGILGLTSGDGLYKLLDMNGTPHALPEHGVLLATTLGQWLGVGPGDLVTVEALEGRRPEFTAEVAGLIDDFSGLAAYMNVDEMNRLMHEQGTVGGVYLSTDPQDSQSLYQDLREAPQVAGVNVKASTIKSFRETVSKNLGIMRSFMVGFSVIIAFGVVYNSARISLSERSRDLATLRVIGFTRREVAIIQLGELATITALAIPVGLVLGYFLSWLTSQATNAELIRIPFIIHPSTFALAASVVVGASLVSGLIVRTRIDKLDLISVLKSRE